MCTRFMLGSYKGGIHTITPVFEDIILLASKNRRHSEPPVAISQTVLA